MKKLFYLLAVLIVFAGFLSCGEEKKECSNECTEDEKKCEENFFLVCGNYDDDTCLEWSEKTPCGQNQTCNNGVCIPICVNECETEGGKVCDGNSVKECGNYDNDSCLEWSTPTACEDGKSCVNGECTSECVNECTQNGVKECVGGKSYKICGQYDNDVCLEWSTVLNCEGEKVCDKGECVEKCKDECEKGKKQCVIDKIQECGNYDADPCLEWSEAKECPQGQSCSGGECSSVCKDECSKDGERICEGNGYKTCGNFDKDQCLDWSSVSPCAENEKCENGKCVLSCQNDCKIGEAQCLTDTEVKICGQYDEDSCLDWSSAIKCGTGLKCVDGKCVLVCSDDCKEKGAKECVDESGYKECGNYDADPCLEWSEKNPCNELEKCKNGICSTEVCENECSKEGEKKCNEFSDGYFVCGNYDDDTCLEWSEEYLCGPDEVCEEGNCVLGCIDECFEGEKDCKDEKTTIVCGNYDDDACFEFGGEKNCEEGKKCEAGECVSTCKDECDEGTKKCSSDENGVLSCGNFDNDTCLEWGDLKTCAEDETCSDGKCSKECSDECKTGEKKCFGNGYAICGQYDPDLCLDWSSIVPCAGWEKCKDGSCVPVCENECEVGEKKCKGEDAYKICGNFDTDPCIEYSEYIFKCEEGKFCDEGDCISDEPSMKLKISEIYYNGPLGDTPYVFIELGGEKNKSLDHFSIRGINGADGKEYVKFSLKGQKTKDDGLFVISHPDAKPPLSDVADMKIDKADFQNGPDSVQILWGSKVIVDAVGYGFTTDYKNFAGEGISSEDTKEGFSLQRNEFLVDTDSNFKDFLISQPTPHKLYSGVWKKEYIINDEKYFKGGWEPKSYIDDNDKFHLAFMGNLFEIYYATKENEGWIVKEVSSGVFTSSPEIGLNMSGKLAIGYEEAGLVSIEGKDILLGTSVIIAEKNNDTWKKKTVYEVKDTNYIWYYSSIRYFPESEFLFFGNINEEFFIVDVLVGGEPEKIFSDFNGPYDVQKDENDDFYIVYSSSDEKAPLKYVKYDWIDGIEEQSTFEESAEGLGGIKVFVLSPDNVMVCYILQKGIEKTSIGLLKGESIIRCAKKVEDKWVKNDVTKGAGEIFVDLSLNVKKEGEKDIISLITGEVNKSAMLFFKSDGTDITKEFVDFGGFLDSTSALSIDKNGKFHIFFKSVNPSKAIIHAEK